MNKTATGKATVIAPYGYAGALSLGLGSGRAELHFRKAQQILRQELPLGVEQFEELDELFRKVSHLQFRALVDDPRHQRQLRGYEVLSWRRGAPLPLILAAFLLVVAAVGTIGSRLSEGHRLDATPIVPRAEAATGR